MKDQTKGSKSEKEFMNFMENNGVKFIDVTPKDPDMIIRKLPKEPEPQEPRDSERWAGETQPEGENWKERYKNKFEIGVENDGIRFEDETGIHRDIPHIAIIDFIQQELDKSYEEGQNNCGLGLSVSQWLDIGKKRKYFEYCGAEAEPEREGWKKRFDKQFATGIGRKWIMTMEEKEEVKEFIQQEKDKSKEEAGFENNMLERDTWFSEGRLKGIEEEKVRKYGGVSEWILYGEKYHFTEFLIGKEKKKWVEEIESLKDQLLKSTKD